MKVEKRNLVCGTVMLTGEVIIGIKPGIQEDHGRSYGLRVGSKVIIVTLVKPTNRHTRTSIWSYYGTVSVKSVPIEPERNQEEIVVQALELVEGDLVDLSTCPYIFDHVSAEFEYAEVAEIILEPSGTLAVSYEGIDTIGYSPYQLLTAVLR